MTGARQQHGSARGVVMADVAAAAGVSHQTVSRVLNDHPAVRPETRRRVLDVIERLGYRRNPAARSLVTRRSGVIGVVTFHTRLYGPTSTLYAIEHAARMADYAVVFASARSMRRTSVLAAVEELRAQAVEGIVVIAPQREAVRSLAALPRDLAMVAVEGGSGGGLPVACVDQRKGARLVVDHLLERGVRTVHHVGGPRNWLEARARADSWRRRLLALDLPVPQPISGDWSPGSGYDAGVTLARRSDVEAVFVANDQMALGVLRAFHEAGVRVPDDVAVAGFDDVPEAAFYTPPLTTVRQDFDEVGRRGVELLLHSIDQAPDLQRRTTVPPELIVRLSSGGGSGSAASPSP